MDEKQVNTEEAIRKINQRLDDMERLLHEKSRINGSTVWVVIPVVAIIMWGLTTIFS